jgi:dihydrofolate reductase
VFVLTHHAREPLEMRGGTTFTFVTVGIESALEQAPAAGDMDVLLGGGAEAANPVPCGRAARRVRAHVVPVLLGDGERLVVHVGPLELRQVRAIEAPA